MCGVSSWGMGRNRSQSRRLFMVQWLVSEPIDSRNEDNKGSFSFLLYGPELPIFKLASFSNESQSSLLGVLSDAKQNS